MPVKIMTDSGCDLPRQIIDDLNIDLCPIIVIKDDKEYLDGQTINPTEVYEGMRNGQAFKSAQIPP